MEKPTPRAIAMFERLLPADPRAVPKKMFGHPAAFVGGNMFFGTFADDLVFRVTGTAQQRAIAAGARVFEPMQGRAWKEYVAISSGTGLPDAELSGWAREALEQTARLPPKEAKKAKKKG